MENGMKIVLPERGGQGHQVQDGSCRLCPLWGWCGAEGQAGTSQTSYLPARQFFQLLPSSHFACCGYDFLVSIRGRWLLFTFTKVNFLVAGICLAISPDFFNQLIWF